MTKELHKEILECLHLGAFNSGLLEQHYASCGYDVLASEAIDERNRIVRAMSELTAVKPDDD